MFQQQTVSEHALLFVIACLCTAIILPFYIGWLKRHQIEQYLREEGPASHAAKAKTPTMGGVCFVAGVLVCTIVLSFAYPGTLISRQTLSVLALALICGGLGFLDDFAKVKERTNKGLSARLRLGIETILGAVFGMLMVAAAYRPALGVIIPPQLAAGFVGIYGFGVDSSTIASLNLTEMTLPPLFIVIISMFVVASTTNAVNLHDGMDGLAAGTATLVLISLSIMLFFSQQGALSCLAMAGAGALVGFLIFNRHPAQIFMGDTGSLFIGGLIAGLVLASGLLLWFIPLSAIYIAEAISVILQVVYFKISKPYEPPKPMSAPAILWLKLTKRLPGEGKRLFRMAPLHHHFEAVLIARGLNQDKAEWQVVGGFWLAQLLLCAITLASFFAF